jgi:hypothetical protein
MNIDELRGWAAFMDRAVIASLVATVLAVSALGITTWLSFRFSAGVRAHEQAVVEQEAATARGRTAALEHEVSAAHERTMALEREAAAARERATTYGQAAREANERVARADSEVAAAGARERAAQLDAAEIQQRLADLGKRVREATASAPAPTEASPAPVPPTQPSPVVAGLRKYAGTSAAVFVLDQAADAAAAGAAISGTLGDAGWAPQTWKWTGVAGILGVVVLVKDGSDSATNEAASAVVEALRSAGFNATKGDWPANWRRFRGLLDGPQTPDPTEALIRIVVGVKPR